MRKIAILLVLISLFFEQKLLHSTGLIKLDQYIYFSIFSSEISRYDFKKRQEDHNVLRRKPKTFTDEISKIREGFLVSETTQVDSSNNKINYYSAVIYYDRDLKKVNAFSSYFLGKGGTSYDGTKTFEDDEWWVVGQQQKKIKFKDFYSDAVFLRDSRHILFNNDKKETWLYDTETQTQKLIASGISPTIGEPAYNHPWIVCSDGMSIYIFDYEKIQLKLVKTFEDPGPWFRAKRGEKYSFLIHSSGFKWLEDDSGFIFNKAMHPHILDPFSYLNPYLMDYGVRTFYFDLEENKEYDLGVSLRDGILLKKPTPEEKKQPL